MVECMKKTICILLASLTLSVANAACTDTVEALPNQYEGVSYYYHKQDEFSWQIGPFGWMPVFDYKMTVVIEKEGVTEPIGVGEESIPYYTEELYNQMVEMAACEALAEALTVLNPGPQQ